PARARTSARAFAAAIHARTGATRADTERTCRSRELSWRLDWRCVYEQHTYDLHRGRHGVGRASPGLPPVRATDTARQLSLRERLRRLAVRLRREPLPYLAGNRVPGGRAPDVARERPGSVAVDRRGPAPARPLRHGRAL